MKKKRAYTTLSILLLTLALLLSSCQGAAEPMETGETKGVATTPGVAQTTEPTETSAATTEKTTERTKPVWTDKNPFVNEEDFIWSDVKLEKIDLIWTDAMIIDPCIVRVIIQPYAAGKEYTVEDFADIGCTEIYINDLRVFEGYHCRWITLCFENPTKSPNYATKIFEKLEEREDVYMIRSTARYELLDVPNDYVEETQWAIEKISLPEAWDISTGSSTVYVGVIDTGIDATHPDLQGRVDTTLSKGFVNDNDPLIDTIGHGTRVAGIIGAAANNSIGLTGVCWDVRLVSLKVGEGDITWHDGAVEAALAYAQEIGLKIVNISLGTSTRDFYIQDAIADFDGLVICAAGNENYNIDGTPSCYPAAFDNDNIISVGASNQDNERALWQYEVENSTEIVTTGSNYGLTSVDLFAPGDNIYTTDISESGYKAVNGTSVAAPFVTGVAALLLSEYPNMTTAQLKHFILENVDEIDALEGYCVTGGRLNAYAALDNVCYSDHTLHVYLYEDCEDGATHEVVCQWCDYESVSAHLCTSFLAHPRLQKHSGTCDFCGAFYSEPHNWVYQPAGYYRCTGCNATTTSNPGTILKDPNEHEMQ